MNLSELNTCDPEAFVVTLGGVWEHSPWVAERSCAMRPFRDVEALCDAMWQCVISASDEEKMSLISAHPDLAGKLARARLLTTESTSEQASAGLDALTAAERDTFDALNEGYREQFGFPFIICVRDFTKQEILAAFHVRLTHSRDVEVSAALEQIRRIANWRILDLIEA